MTDVYWCYKLPPLEEAKRNRILVGCVSRLSTIFKTVTLIAGILTQLPKIMLSVVGWRKNKHEALQYFTDTVKI